MESPIILQTNRLKLYYGAFEALKGIDMQIPENRSPLSSGRPAAENLHS